MNSTLPTGPNNTTKRFEAGDGIWNINRAMMTRAFYVIIAVTAIVLLYFILRFVKARRRKTKRYGRLISANENVEMSALASDSEDDVTMFDASAASKNLIN